MNSPVRVIPFEGGLGAQVLSAGAFYYLQMQGLPVCADLKYFKLHNYVLQLKAAGQPYKSDVSIFPWQLGELGVNEQAFSLVENVESEVYIGQDDLKLAFDGLAQTEIAAKFLIPKRSYEIHDQIAEHGPIACVHVRRGDYLKVATHLKTDGDFIKIIAAISRIVKTFLILSDSPLSRELEDALRKMELRCYVAVGGPASVAHGLMRLADVLVASNSQLSYSAAALRSSFALSILPSQHDGDLNSSTNKYLASMRDFQIFCR